TRTCLLTVGPMVLVMGTVHGLIFHIMVQKNFGLLRTTQSKEASAQRRGGLCLSNVGEKLIRANTCWILFPTGSGAQAGRNAGCERVKFMTTSFTGHTASRLVRNVPVVVYGMIILTRFQIIHLLTLRCLISVNLEPLVETLLLNGGTQMVRTHGT